MPMKTAEIKFLFKFTATQRIGILLLFLFMGLFQLLYCFLDFTPPESSSAEKQEWMALQLEIDSLKKDKREYVPKIYPFNPNFITDFKGYKLGMSTVEIDRLLAFRKSNKWINSAADFQKVTKVSDSLLTVLAPCFKFPDWVKKKPLKNYKAFPGSVFHNKETIAIIDINLATQEDLIKVNGIGPALSERILKEKEKYGGFVSMEQIGYIWGLSPEVIEKLNKYFKISTTPATLKRININTASVKELAQFPFFRYQLAKEIVTYRSMNGGIHGSEDLIKIKGFPIEKAAVIVLYLDF